MENLNCVLNFCGNPDFMTISDQATKNGPGSDSSLWGSLHL